MWPFTKEPTKADLQAHKKIVIGEYRFTIRRINPLLDFEPDRMPQIFKPPSRKPERTDRKLKPSEAVRINEDMAAVIEMGVVSPRFVPVGRGSNHGNEEGITAEDVLRWDDVGVELYAQIVSWSLVQFRGLKGAMQFSANKAALLDTIAKRYGVRPSDLAFKGQEATPADRQFVDHYAAVHGSQAEARAMKEASSKSG